MAVYTDFFVALPDEAAALDVQVGPLGLPTIQAKSVHHVKLAILDEILTGVPDRFPEDIAEYTGGDSFIYALAEPLVEALAALSPEEAQDAARRWSQAEDWKLDGWTTEEVHDFLEELRELAIRARSERKRLYLWVSVSAPSYDRYTPRAQGRPAT